MKIDGKAIAVGIFEQLQIKVKQLQEKGITPHVAIVLVGDDPASKAYVGQKEKKAHEIGAKASVYFLPASVTQDELVELIRKLNNDASVHGIIVQRPLPSSIDSEVINETTNPLKDIDAFRKDSSYPMPLPAAVLKTLEHIFSVDPLSYMRTSALKGALNTHDTNEFANWLRTKNIVVAGKGETGGGPVITMLREMGIHPSVIDSKTPHPESITKHADVIISTAGRQGILKPDMLKKGVILIGVGMQKGKDGKLHGDYSEEEIKDIASFYTPIPGGVGPVNVAMLLENLILAAEAQNK